MCKCDEGGGGDCVTRRDFLNFGRWSRCLLRGPRPDGQRKRRDPRQPGGRATAAARLGAVAAAAAVRRALTPKKMRAAASRKATTPKMAAQTVGAMSNSWNQQQEIIIIDIQCKLFLNVMLFKHSWKSNKKMCCNLSFIKIRKMLFCQICKAVKFLVFTQK